MTIKPSFANLSASYEDWIFIFFESFQEISGKCCQYSSEKVHFLSDITFVQYTLASLNLANTIVCLSEGKITPPPPLRAVQLGPFQGSFRAHFRARRRKTVQSSQAGKENLGIKYSSTSNINNKFFLNFACDITTMCKIKDTAKVWEVRNM